MVVTYNSQLRRPYYPGHGSSYLDIIDETDEEIDPEELRKFAGMAELDAPGKSRSTTDLDLDQMAAAKEASRKQRPADAKASGGGGSTRTPSGDGEAQDYLSVHSGTYDGLATPSTPGLSRTTSSTDIYGNFEPFGQNDFPPVDRLTMFDILENLALPQRLEKMQSAVHNQAEKVRRQRAKLANRALSSRNTVVEEWRKRVKVQPEEQLEKYRQRMKVSVDRLSTRWSDAKTVTLKEKISFVVAVLNIFVSAYLIGAFPEYFHWWYTLQLAYFMPIRWYNYHKIGFHYFLADLCYFVNLLLILSIWFFPQSKRLFISTYCLAFGNNAIAIAMWRNSLVFHSLDKVTSLFIHIMPCVTLHVLVHLIPQTMQLEMFPAIHTIKYSPPSAPEHYRLGDMILWATLPYAVWQLSYHFLITVRKRSKIAAGRPTSFTWLRKSYRANILGKFVLSFPEYLQEVIFMGIQYGYALLTMMPCPIWFWYRWASAGFMLGMFAWASWNGATYYIDAYGRRFEKELEHLRKEVARMAKSPEMSGQDGLGGAGSPFASPVGPLGTEGDGGIARTSALDLGPAAKTDGATHRRSKSEDSAQATDTDGGVPSPAVETPGLEVRKVLGNPAAPATSEVDGTADLGAPRTGEHAKVQ
ncbi:hypothetical protein LTR36_002798 [Oleoguttula mirabilis]|uniref:Glycerophosphocholine acyltransferase 1 n=1 Tax=Oleoguttula mirabilis TaxID=1507867 RepID=A0AAV9JKE7_9PEZI|nr:hypothetical protein LTR36_002798 [Oleoguttula mirabilis]